MWGGIRFALPLRFRLPRTVEQSAAASSAVAKRGNAPCFARRCREPGLDRNITGIHILCARAPGASAAWVSPMIKTVADPSARPSPLFPCSSRPESGNIKGLILISLGLSRARAREGRRNRSPPPCSLGLRYGPWAANRCAIRCRMDERHDSPSEGGEA